MAVERFEDLIAWQRAREMTRLVYAVTRREPICRDFRFTSQIQSASVSIMSNIAEGFEWKRPRQFQKFLGTAKSSCAEVRSLLYVALDNDYVTDDQFNQLITMTTEIARMIAGLLSSQRRYEQMTSLTSA